MHSTNYRNTLILPAPDTRAVEATAPPTGKGTVAEMQYERLAGRDYTLTSDDLLFDVHCARRGIAEADREREHAAFFAKGQPCLRSSPLTKTYGWAVHADGEARVALVETGSDRFAELLADDATRKVPAMRSSR